MMDQLHVIASSSAWMQTLGRLHVVIVHFPIALLLVGAMIEMAQMIRRKTGPTKVGSACVVLGAVSAGIAAWFGYIHRGFSNFGKDSLTTANWHEWLGIASACV